MAWLTTEVAISYELSFLFPAVKSVKIYSSWSFIIAFSDVILLFFPLVGGIAAYLVISAFFHFLLLASLIVAVININSFLGILNECEFAPVFLK